MKLIYTAGKYSAATDEEKQANVALARMYATRLWEQGYGVICPHLNTHNFEHLCMAPYESYMQADFLFVEKCDAIFMLPNWKESSGARREYEHAIDKCIPVLFTLEDTKNFLAKEG